MSVVGPSDALAAKLFQQFTQADASMTRKFGGMRLGSAITKQLCEAMAGASSLQSQFGEGVTLTLQMPKHHTKNDRLILLRRDEIIGTA